MRKLTRLLGKVGIVLLLCGCGNLQKGTEPQIEIYLGEQGVRGDWEFSNTIIPGTGIAEQVKISIKNNGDEELIVESVKLLDKNSNGTEKNAYVSIKWLSIDPLKAFANGYAIAPNDAASRLEFQVEYKPEKNDKNGATLEVRSNDPKTPVKYINFKPFACIQSVFVHPGKTTYFNASPSAPEQKKFRVYNDGTCEVTVNNVDFGGPTKVFDLKRAWPNGSKIQPSEGINDPNADFLEFTVTYQPTTGCGADQTVVMVETDAPGKEKLGIALTTQCEDCCYRVSYDDPGENNYLDFTTVNDGSKTIIVNVINECEAPFIVVQQGISFPGDTSLEAKENPLPPHYSYDICLPTADPGVQNCDNVGKTVSISEGQSMDIKVTYSANSVEGIDSKMQVRYKCAGIHQFEIPTRGGKPKPCLDLAPGSAANPNVIQFVGSVGTTTDRNFVVYNCGEADLELTGITIEDEFYPGEPSKNFALSTAFAAPEVISPGGLKVFNVVLDPDKDASPDFSALMTISYKGYDGADLTTTSVELQVYINLAEEVTKPKADAGKSEDYPGAKAGQNLTITGIGSMAGSEGLAEKGYLWYLLSKPAASKLIINGSPGGPALTLVPDAAGTYEFALQVHSAGGLFLYSDEATVKVQVAPGD